MGNDKFGKANYIEAIVFKFFVRVIKDDGTYMYFRRGVKNNDIMSALIGKMHNLDSPFTKFSTNEEVIDELYRITKESAKNENKDVSTMDRYEHVTMAINHLLHFFMEVNGMSIEKLSSLGEEIYGLSCHSLFGDKIENLKENNAPTKNSERGKTNLKEFLDYIDKISSKAINPNVSFNDFIKNVKGIDIETQGMGHLLGKKFSSDTTFMIDTETDGMPF